MSLTAIAYILFFVGGTFLALFRHPIYGLATYVILVFMDPESRWWGHNLPDLRWSMAMAIVVLIAYQMHKGRLRPVRRGTHGIFVALSILAAWMVLQTPWALWPNQEIDLEILFLKYVVLLYLFHRVVDSDKAMRVFLWSYVLGCFYLGWVAYTNHGGGRFEGFGGSGLGEANVGALTLVTGILAAGPLFLTGSRKEQIALIGVMPFIVNGMILAASRSAFLALLCGGLVFLWYAPKRYRRRIMTLGALGVVLFLILTNDFFWGRMSSIEYAGEKREVHTDEGYTYDTGSSRLDIMKAQWRMFVDHPSGTGHRGTAALSPLYLPDSELTGPEGFRFRASHNTVLTLLVEHSVIGVGFYFYALWWIYRSIRLLYARYRLRFDFRATMIPTVAAILVAISAGDMFVDYLKYEPRIWFFGVLMIMRGWLRSEKTSLASAQRDVYVTSAHRPAGSLPLATGDRHAGRDKTPAAQSSRETESPDPRIADLGRPGR